MIESTATHHTQQKKEIVCPRYEVIHRYIQLTKRPLTALEQRAFLYLLDLDVDERFEHADDESGACICMDIMPEIVQALEPDPVEHVVAERTLEGQSYAAQRWHTEKVGRNQGIVLGLKTKKQHTNDLRKLARKQLEDFDIVIRELIDRAKPEYKNARAMIEGELPKFLELVRLAQSRKSPPKTEGPLTIDRAREMLARRHEQGAALLKSLEGRLRRWGIAG